VQTAENNVETKVLAGPPEIIAAAAIAAEPGLVADATPAMDQVAQLPGLETAAVNAAPGIMQAVAPAISSSSGALGYLGGLAGLFAGIAAVPHNGPHPPPTPIPEPSGLVALAGCLGLAGALRPRRRRTS
jgi:hypothetical protein